ncbi:MAG: Hydrogenase-4 component B [Alphaproteobacteria bacterium MarineAlpha11_Bin1]|nr:MAG: Hydrogenase-4 component B [Alphaproteobacteria bacterium MarineAlpha11_Bin1]|tara:strand:+ start:8093 stop:9781 length:1689 start_codon:yes stop_codon:yes gene_type:complete
MLFEIPPGLLLILGVLVLPLLPTAWRKAYITFLPLAGLWALIGAEQGISHTFTLFSYEITPVRIDNLSLIFGYIFHIAAVLSVIFAWHNEDIVDQMAGLAYAGAGIGAVFAGDLITLFVYWEIMAVTSVFLIWARRTDAAYRAGMRYLIIQVGSGVLLLSGAILLAHQTGSIAFEKMMLDNLATWLILVAFGIKCAFPFLHNWLPDAYPEATATGAVFLSVFTTKCAVYVLARGFPGTELLIYVGAVMAAFPLFYALIENDLRRVLSYSLNNQLGFMVVGIGIGSALAINGVAAHAFAHILYKSLLFMAMGAVLYRAGTVKASDLGALYKSMPLTAFFCIIGALSISTPLFAGYVGKSLTISAVAKGSHEIIWIVLMFASAGVFLVSGVKVVYFAFFGSDSGNRYREAPPNMLVGMGLTSLLCIGIGVYSPWLYSLLPYEVVYNPYTTDHIINQLQLLLFTALAFAVLIRFKLFPPPVSSINLDFDVTYRKWLPGIYHRSIEFIFDGWNRILLDLRNGVRRFVGYMFRHHGPEGILARTWPTGSMALWVALLLGGILLIYYS